MPKKTQRSLMVRFGWLIVLLTTFGVVLAIVADRASAEGEPYWDAIREIGGALVAGGVVAGVVVWFEDRREAERDEKADERAAEALAKAWRRPHELRLNTLIKVEISRLRWDWREAVAAQTGTGPIEARLQNAADELRATASFLREPTALQELSERWIIMWEEVRGLVANEPQHAVRTLHGRFAVDEQRRFDRLVDALNLYLQTVNPLPANLPVIDAGARD